MDLSDISTFWSWRPEGTLQGILSGPKSVYRHLNKILKMHYWVFWMHPGREHCIYFCIYLLELMRFLSTHLSKSLSQPCYLLVTSFLPAMCSHLLYLTFPYWELCITKCSCRNWQLGYFFVVCTSSIEMKSSPFLNWSTVRTLPQIRFSCKFLHHKLC